MRSYGYLSLPRERRRPLQTHNALFLTNSNLGLDYLYATSCRLYYEVIGDIGLPCLPVKKAKRDRVRRSLYHTQEGASVGSCPPLKGVWWLAPEVSDQMRGNSHAALTNMAVCLFFGVRLTANINLLPTRVMSTN